MPFVFRKPANPLRAAAAMLGMLLLPISAGAESSASGAGAAEPVIAQYRGCESAGWCRFWIEPRKPMEEPLHRVRPEGLGRMRGNDAVSIAMRDRLNALLASFVHQHKRIVLYGLRELEDGTFAATVTVNESEVSSDPFLQELLEKSAGTIR